MSIADSPPVQAPIQFPGIAPSPAGEVRLKSGRMGQGGRYVKFTYPDI